jgi:hypothetical protein
MKRIIWHLYKCIVNIWSEYGQEGKDRSTQGQGLIELIKPSVDLLSRDISRKVRTGGHHKQIGKHLQGVHNQSEDITGSLINSNFTNVLR